MAETAIEWATHVWNPVTGCSRVSPGCAHCYALTYAARLKAMGQPKYQRDGGRGSGPGFGVTLHEDELAAPARWRKPRRVFVNSMSDLFHEDIPDEYVADVFAVMAMTQRHTFMVLTKRPERMKALLTDSLWWAKVGDAIYSRDGDPDEAMVLFATHGTAMWLANCWLGVSIENRKWVGRADVLRQTPAACRFVSAEPLLGPLRPDSDECNAEWADGYVGPGLNLTGIDWLIAGGESGPRHRPVNPEWVRGLRDVCLVQRLWEPGTGPDPAGARTRFFFKQWGGHTPKAGGRELDGRTWDELPIREFGVGP